MTLIKDKIKACVFLAIDNYNAFQTKDQQLEKSVETVIFSRMGFTREGKLDSIGIVNLLVLIEEKMKIDFGNEFILDVSEVIENKESILTDIDSLINYLETKLK